MDESLKLPLDDAGDERAQIHLLPTLRDNLTAIEMDGMPDKSYEQSLRARFEAGDIDDRDDVDELLMEIAATPAGERKPHKYLFDLARRHLGGTMRAGSEVGTISSAHWHDVERLRLGVLALSLIDSVKCVHWFQQDLIEEAYEQARNGVLQPEGHNIFDLCRALANERPLNLTQAATRGTRLAPERLQIVASIAYYFHLRNDGVVKMPTEFVGALWGLKGESARNVGSTVIRALVNVGLLKKAKNHVPMKSVAVYRFCENRRDLYDPPLDSEEVTDDIEDSDL